MRFGNWCNVPESQASVILVDHISRNLTADYLVKEGIFFRFRSLCLDLLTNIIFFLAHRKSDILFYVREVPLEVKAIWLTTHVRFEMQTDK